MAGLGLFHTLSLGPYHLICLFPIQPLPNSRWTTQKAWELDAFQIETFAIQIYLFIGEKEANMGTFP